MVSNNKGENKHQLILYLSSFFSSPLVPRIMPNSNFELLGCAAYGHCTGSRLLSRRDVERIIRQAQLTLNAGDKNIHKEEERKR
jgi:hypothetical protein